MPPERDAGLEPLNEAVDHVRGGPAGRLIAAELDLDVARFDGDRIGAAVLARVRRDVQSGMASGELRGTPTLFIDGVVHRGGGDAGTLLEVLAR